MNDWQNMLKIVWGNIHKNPLFDISLLTFSGVMCCFAIALKDWVGFLFTCYPLNLFIVYCFTQKKMSKAKQEILIFILSLIYLIYIWQPLVDGTVGDAIRELAIRQ